MAELSRFVIDWWLRCAVAGGVLLLVGYLVISLTRQPAKKLAAGFWTLVIALLLPPLTLLPGWLALPWQSPFAAPQRQVVKQEVKRDIATVMTPQQREKAIAPTEVPLLDEVWDQPIPEAGWRSSVPVPASASPKPTAISPARDTSPQSAVEMPAVPEKSWGIWLAWIGLLSYGVVGFWFAFKLLVGQVGLIRLWRSGRPVPNAIRQLFDRMTRHLEHKPEVRITDRVAGPICFGVFRPRIMLQAGLGHGSDTQTLRWIFAHELSHVERKDPLTGWLLGFAQAIYFFCPWFWWLRRDVRLSQEFLADAAAIDDRKGNHSRLTSSATDYADFLVRMASCRAVPIGAAGVRGTTSDLFRRVKMLVQKSQKMEGTCSRRWSLLAGGGLLTLGIALAGFYLPTNSLTAAQAPEKKEAKKAEPTKPADPADDDDEIRKAVEELKKGPTPRVKDKDEPKNPAPPAVQPNPFGGPGVGDLQRQQEAMRRMMEQLQRQGGQPGNAEDLNRMVEEMMKQMQGQLQLQPGLIVPQFPGWGRGGNFGRGGVMRPNNRGGLFATNNDGRVGIRIEPPSAVLIDQLDLPREKGMVITDVRLDSPADKAGIKINDIMLEVDGKAVSSEPQEFVRMVSEIKAETPVNVTVLRKGRKETLKGMKLPELPQPPQFPALQPFPNLRVPANPGFPQVIPPVALVPGGAEAVQGMSVTRNNDEFTIKFSANELKGTVSGVVVDGKAVVSDISIDDNGRNIKAKSVDKLEAKYQKMVERMLNSVR